MSRPNSELEPILEAVEMLEAERLDINAQKQALLKDAESKGYPKKVVNNILKRRKKERDEVLESDRQTRQFEQELGYETLE